MISGARAQHVQDVGIADEVLSFNAQLAKNHSTVRLADRRTVMGQTTVQRRRRHHFSSWTLSQSRVQAAPDCKDLNADLAL